MRVALPYGHDALPVEIPDANLVHIAEAEDPPGIANVEEAVRTAIRTPIASQPLADIVHPGDTVALVVNDVTRPFLSDKLLPPVLGELNQAGIEDEDITILIATGLHRANTTEEQHMMLGQLPEGVTVINHDAKDDRSLVRLGTTRRGTPVTINRAFVEAKVKILTGLISPHQQAGFTGGRKAVLPGIASYDSIKVFHAFPICPRDVAVGRLEGNLTHEEALEAARMAGVDFIVNAVPNAHGEIFRVVAGDVYEAWLAGVETWREKLQVRIPEYADIAIVSPGGYPRDINLWQSQKAIAAAELMTRPSGTIILVAQCADGLGEESLRWYEWLTQAEKPRDVLARFEHEGHVNGSSKAYMFARALQSFRLLIVSEAIDTSLLRRMFFEPTSSVQEALDRALAQAGRSARIVVVPRAVECLPTVDANPCQLSRVPV